MSKTVAEIESEIQEIKDLSIEEMRFWLFERQQNKTVKLASNYETIAPIEGKHRWFEYVFKEPVFLSHVTVLLDGYHPTDQFEFQYTNRGGEIAYGYARAEKSEITFEVSKVCKAFAFRPPRTWLRSTYVNRVQVFGFKDTDTESFIRFVREIDTLKEEAISEIGELSHKADKRIELARQKESQRDQVNSEIADAETRLSSLRSEISSQSAELSELVAKVGAKETQLDNLEEQEQRVRSEVKILTEKRNSRTEEFDTLEARLSQIRDEIDIFPSEISGFVSQAAKDIKTYSIYTIIFTFVIFGMFVWVLLGSFDLSEFVKENPTRNVWQLIAAKLPMSLVVAAIVTTSYKLARVFVQEQLNINRQKLSLTQMSIIAKDISQASEHEIDLNKEEVYSARLKVKMSLLSEHIKTFVKSEPADILPNKLFGLRRKQSDYSTEDQSG